MATRPRLTAVLALILTLASGRAHAAETRFQHVSLLAASDRVSLVFELTGEPQNVATRRISAAVLELDAGPVVMPARATSFMAPPGVRFVMGVSIQGGDAASGRLKARITMLERVRSAVRVVGNRVYVDFSPESALVSPQLAPAAARQSAPAAPAAASVAAPAASVGSSSSMRDAYRATIQPAFDRFDQLTPFLLSAAASPSEPVLKAVGSTLVGIQGLLLSVDVPADSRRVHDAVSSAVGAALTAVSPTFAGDRAAQAKQALSLLDQARNSW